MSFQSYLTVTAPTIGSPFPKFRLLVAAVSILARCTRLKEANMTIQQRISVLAAALLYAGISISVIAMPDAAAEISAVAIGYGNTHI